MVEKYPSLEISPIIRDLNPYGATDILQKCPMSWDWNGNTCDEQFPDHPDLGSYVVNAATLFGLNESEVRATSDFILYAERRTKPSEVGEYCNYTYRPWFNTQNPVAPANDFDDKYGAIETLLHNEKSSFAFADGHVKSLAFSRTYSFADRVDLHRP